MDQRCSNRKSRKNCPKWTEFIVKMELIHPKEYLLYFGYYYYPFLVEPEDVIKPVGSHIGIFSWVEADLCSVRGGWHLLFERLIIC